MTRGQVVILPNSSFYIMPSATNYPQKTSNNKPKNIRFIPLVFFVLIIAALAVIFYILSPGQRGKAETKIESPVEIANRLDRLITSVQRRETVIVPDVQLPETPAPDNKVRLTGILWNTDKPMVIINNHVLGIGDSVDGYLIVDIKEDNVVLKDEQGEETAYYLQAK